MGSCERRSCGEGDVQVIRTLGYVLCEGVGGIGGGNASSADAGNATSATGTAPVVGFTGGGGRVGGGVGWGMLAVLVVGGLGGL